MPIFLIALAICYTTFNHLESCILSLYWNENSIRAEILSVLYIAVSQNLELSLTHSAQ